MTNYKKLTNHKSTYFDSVPLTRESWIPVSQELEDLIENLASLNGAKQNIAGEEFKEYLKNAGQMIENGYKFLNDNKELLSQSEYKLLKQNTEILLANARSIHAFLDVHSVIEGARPKLK